MKKQVSGTNLILWILLLSRFLRSLIDRLTPHTRARGEGVSLHKVSFLASFAKPVPSPCEEGTEKAGISGKMLPYLAQSYVRCHGPQSRDVTGSGMSTRIAVEQRNTNTFSD